MKLKEIPIQELELLSYTAIAKMYLEENKTTKNTADLFREVCNLLNLSDDEYVDSIADFFESLTTSKEFILLEDGTWDFAALDKNGDTIEGYPLPDKNRVGRITFSYDGSTATDDQGQTYKVYEYEMDDEGYFDDTQEYDD